MNFEKRKRKLSAFLALAASLLVDEYGDNDDPVIISVFDIVKVISDTNSYYGMDDKVAEDYLALFISLVIAEYVTDIKYLIERISELDIDTKNRFIRMKGIKGQKDIEKISAIEKDPICKEIFKTYPYFKERLLEVQSQGPYYPQ